jgi:hypothetical protein
MTMRRSKQRCQRPPIAHARTLATQTVSSAVDTVNITSTLKESAPPLGLAHGVVRKTTSTIISDPKADYSTVKDKWTLFYNLEDPKMAGGDLQPFSVTVEDKTKKVEIRRN